MKKKKLLSYADYLLSLQKLIQRRKERSDMLFSKKDMRDDLDFEISEIGREIEDLDKRISVNTFIKNDKYKYRP